MRWSTRAPAFVAGAFVVVTLAAGAATDRTALARQLLEDGCRAECRRECVRLLAAAPGDAEVAALRDAAAGDGAGGAAERETVRSLPGRLLVGLYRSVVRPAIGARCALDPSCSEYFLIVSRRHGLLGFPMIVDRFVREPSVLRAHPVPAPPGGNVRVPDPVCDHDFWMSPRHAATCPHRGTPP
ncbi:MAG: membrane protein insertion efficiency factor YidD [Lentisphaerae bacterium]|nr:membrane protein insertion efficiency factor YidD [Lentisphaerota bacterium]